MPRFFLTLILGLWLPPYLLAADDAEKAATLMNQARAAFEQGRRDEALKSLKALLDRSNAFGYGEIQEGGRRSPSTLMSAFGQIRDPHFIGVTITRKEDVYPALKQFFSTRDEAGLAAMAR